MTADDSTNPTDSAHAISAQVAVARAEAFIRLNGYTLAPAASPERLTEESFELWEKSRWAEIRHDLLQPRAYGYLRGRKRGPGWTVVFPYRRDDGGKEQPVGRAVTMNEDGSAIRVEHVDIFLDAVEECLPSRAE